MIDPCRPPATIALATSCAQKARPLQIDVQDLVPVVLRHLKERDARKHSGIVDQSVDWAEPLLGRQYHRLDLLYPAHVGLDQDRAPALGAYLVSDTLGGGIVIEPVDRHVGTRGSKFARHRTTDPLLRPRD